MATNAKMVKVSIMDIKPILDRNNRFYGEVAGVKVNTYDIPTMVSQIKERDGITDPLKINVNNESLQGNRRTLAGQQIVQNPDKWLNDVSSDRRELILKNLTKNVPALRYENLTPDEELDIINDHGERKDLGRAELVQTVWRMHVAGHKSSKISNQLYYLLARFTGNTKKLSELEGLSPADRAARIKTWFHGTVDNRLIGAYKMGPRVRQAYLITEMINDGLIKKVKEGDEWVPTTKPEFNATTKRLTELHKAYKQDDKEGKWNAETYSGPAFDKLLEQYITEDKTGGPARVSDPRMKLDDLKDRSTQSLSPAFRVAFKIASGQPVDDAIDVDRASARADAILRLIEKHFEQIANPQVKDVLAKVLVADPNDFEQFLLSQCETVTENVPTDNVVAK